MGVERAPKGKAQGLLFAADQYVIEESRRDGGRSIMGRESCMTLASDDAMTMVD